MRKLVQIRPAGGRLEVSISFNCSWENIVIFYDQGTGQRLFSCNSHNPGDSRTWAISNPSHDTYQILEISGQHKNSPPDPTEPWHESAWQQLNIIAGPPQQEVIGFEDAGDGDFNDVQVTITHY